MLVGEQMPFRSMSDNDRHYRSLLADQSNLGLILSVDLNEH